jgi:hypothetical protein
MKVEVSGTRDGQVWPPRGEVLDVEDNEGAALCAAGMADPVKDDQVETAVPSTEDVETRELTDTEKEADRNAAEANDLEALQAEAKAAGVKVDKRWGADRLRQELDAAGEK